jgi:hypothetical protein
VRRALCLILAAVSGGPDSALAQEVAAPAAEIVETSRSVPDGKGANLIIERIAPPVIPPPEPVTPVHAADPEAAAAAAARRAQWLAEGPVAIHLLPMHATFYPDGLTYLTWWWRHEDGRFEEFGGWSTTDFRSLQHCQDLTVGRIRYSLSALVMDGSRRKVGPHPRLGPLKFEPDVPGFVLVTGDPGHATALGPIRALHQLYAEQGAKIHADWAAAQLLHRQEAERLRNEPPPPPQDTVIRYWIRETPAAAPSNSTPGKAAK